MLSLVSPCFCRATFSRASGPPHPPGGRGVDRQKRGGLYILSMIIVILRLMALSSMGYKARCHDMYTDTTPYGLLIKHLPTLPCMGGLRHLTSAARRLPLDARRYTSATPRPAVGRPPQPASPPARQPARPSATSRKTSGVGPSGARGSGGSDRAGRRHVTSWHTLQG